ncbi:PAS domain-containing sensor histidine kinase [Pedobacter ureilyticus]|uniref:histidine kinase n=1 Tax=Pedobacter ureilyticus TaxID=1393051 RepID=A0ABW9J9T8_9SPHI|nr:PAS domain-containing sensor histidine kinase [Pedobacter helvus]
MISDDVLNRALEQASLGFWEVNLVSGNFMSCTAQCKRNFGWDTSKPFSYEDMVDSIIEEDRTEMQKQVFDSISQGKDYFAEYRVRHPDDSIHWIRAQGRVDFDNNVPQIISGTTLDITNIKNIELLRDELINVAVHELKTPLSTVKMALQLLQKGSKEDAARSEELVSRALKANDRMKLLLDEVAQPINVQLKEMHFDKVSFDLITLANEVARNTEMVNAGYSIGVTTIHEELPVYADRNRIGQVISNLVNNAVKYAGEGVDITIDISRENSTTVLKVSDNGIGIPAADRSRIFEKYYRSTSTNTKEGLGLGLFICSEIISKHGGAISVDDRQLQGTTIMFHLPDQADMSVG